MRLHRTVNPKSRLRRSAASTLRVGVAASFAAAGVSGCSVLYDLSTEQCKSTADCVALGGVFETFECRENLCQEPIFNGCRTNAECIDTKGDGVLPYACIDTECVRLDTTECPTILPVTGDLGMANLRSDADGREPLILAGTSVTGQNAFDDVGFRNYDLALTELSNKVGGINLGQRPIVMLACNASVESDAELDRIMTHVVDELKIPGMVTAFLADDLQKAWLNKGKAAETFFMSTQEADATLAALPDKGLMWHVGPAADVIARPYAPLLTRTLAHLAVTGPVKVATVVASDVRFLVTTVEAIEASPAQHGLSFNDTDVSTNQGNGYYKRFSVAYNESAANSSAVVQDLIAFRPHVIISAGGPEFYKNIITGVERDWGSTDTQPKPFYILSAFNYNRADQSSPVITANPTVRTRMLGVNAAAAEDDSNYKDYTSAWDGAYPDMAGVRGYENYYDAAYYLMYAAAAASRTSDISSGADLGTGMQSLLSGDVKNVGSRGMVSALQAIAVGDIQLNGTLGPPDFDSLGVRQTPGDVYCINSAKEFVPDVLRYSQSNPADATTATLTGTVPTTCLDNF
jgi:hypothetical protein